MANHSKACLETINLIKIYRKRMVVNRVCLNVEQGEIVGILGPNGAGKTTTFRMIVGLISADDGEIFFDQQNISRMPMYARARMGIGYLPQEPTVFSRLTVKENIEIILEHMKLPRQERNNRRDSLLDEMQLASLQNSKAGNLSGGERRRLEVARALVTRPAFIMLDEPFAAIDPKLVEGLQEVILTLRAKNIGILITDHKPRETLSITDRTYIINKGCILRHGKTAELVADDKVRNLYLGKKFFMPEAMSDMPQKLKQAQEKIAEQQHQKALSLLTEALAMEPGNAQAHYLRGCCFFHTGEFVSARLDFETTCRIDSKNALARRNVGQVPTVDQ